jgi:hypothetical protein
MHDESKDTTCDSESEQPRGLPSLDDAAFSEEANKPPLRLIDEFFYLVVHDRKWWIVPLLLSIVFVAIGVALTQSAIVPFVYTLF